MNRCTLYLVLTMLAFAADNAMARSGSDRTGSWDFGITVMGQSSETLAGQEGASFEVWKLELLWPF